MSVGCNIGQGAPSARARPFQDTPLPFGAGRARSSVQFLPHPSQPLKVACVGSQNTSQIFRSRSMPAASVLNRSRNVSPLQLIRPHNANTQSRSRFSFAVRSESPNTRPRIALTPL